MKYTVGQIKEMLEELDKELPEVDENAREADRQQTIRLISGLVANWLERGYSYSQIASKLREKGLIRISEKTLRQVAPKKKRRKKIVSIEHGKLDQNVKEEKKPSNTTRSSKSVSLGKESSTVERPGRFLPREDSEDI